MKMDVFLHLPVWTLIKIIFIYIYTRMYGKIKENSDTKFWFVLIRVLPSRLLWGVPPHQIPLKPPNLQLFTPHLLPLLPIPGLRLPSASKELFLAFILWKITDSNTTQWSDNEQCGGLGATETSGIQSTNGFWDLVVWDLNRGTPKESNPFHFGGFQESKPPGLLEKKKKHTSENWIWWSESLKCHVYIILEKIPWSCLPPKLITIHESQSLPRWTCQQQKDMAITFVAHCNGEPLRTTRSRSKPPWKKYFLGGNYLNVSYMSSKWVNVCFMSSQNSLLLAHVHLKEFILSDTVVFQLDISERARLI